MPMPAHRRPQPPARRRHIAVAVAAAALVAAGAAPAAPRTVHFPGGDGATELVGYVFEPPSAARVPAVVLLHGRAGPYSSRVSGACTVVARATASRCGADTLSRRHLMWGEAWAARGYVALLVDSYGPRGLAHGFARHSHDDPQREAVNERTVRPLDAEAALAWLVTQPRVRPERLFIQGWSNGASTVLNVMQRQAQGLGGRAHVAAALAFYPGCGPKALLARTLQLDAPVLLLLGSQDEEVAPTICREVAARSGGPAGAPQVQWYEGASHDFDDPGKQRQSQAANRAAKDDAMQRAPAWFDAVR